MTKGFPFRLSVLLAGFGFGFGQAAQACIVFVPRNPADIRFADVVVIGKIKNYHIVIDKAARVQRRQMIENSINMINMSPSYRSLLEKQKSYTSDYAQFDVTVEKTIRGKPQKVLHVTWNNSTFGEPTTMPQGPYLIALRRPTSASLLQRSTGTVSTIPKQTVFTPVQATCSSPFILEKKVDQDDALRRLSGMPPWPKDR